MTHALTRRAAALALALGLAGTALPAAAQTAPAAWPKRPVKFIIPFGAGAGADIGARLISEKLAQKWGQAVIIENKPGGDGLLAINSFLNANDDHVLMFAAVGSFTVHPYQIENLNYVMERDLLPIAQFSSTIIGVGMPAASGVKSMKDFIAKAKANPGKLNAALVPGITELVWDGFAKTEGIDVVKVPYKNIVPAAGDLAESRLDIMAASYAILRPVAEGGKVSVIAQTGPKRASILPDIPTTAESGAPSMELEGLVGLLGPKIMSQELRNKIGADVVAVASEPEIAKLLTATGQVPAPAGAVEFEASLKKQIAQVAAIAKLIGMPRLSGAAGQ